MTTVDDFRRFHAMPKSTRWRALPRPNINGDIRLGRKTKENQLAPPGLLSSHRRNELFRADLCRPRRRDVGQTRTLARSGLATMVMR
jgi:hypothetical protein